MRKSIAAVLLSALVCPGAGHLYLRSYPRGIVLLIISAVALADFVRRAWQQAELIRDQLIAHIDASGVIDLEFLIARTLTELDRIDRQPFTTASLILLACWLIGIADSYRLGKKMEQASPIP